jgi:menaquinone-9 beta-reductase
METLKHTSTALDVLIIGAGPAGSSTALLLAQAGWSVGIIEKKEFPRRKVCGEFISATNLPLLKKLNLVDFYLNAAGPDVERVGLYVSDLMLAQSMPSSNHPTIKWGRALGREQLDTALLQQASQAGVKIWQPYEPLQPERQDNLFGCIVNTQEYSERIIAPILIMANGSWEGVKTPHKPSDLLGFKAHFLHSSLPEDLMPLLAYPGGYGGMVHSDNGRTSLSCCIRRDLLEQIRTAHSGMQAGDAVLEYLKTSCLGVQQTLSQAKREGSWLACGPIKPGIRQRYHQGIFFVGNSAGEAHPVVAEGISMAMQAGWLLSQTLIKHRHHSGSEQWIGDAGRDYSKLWYQHFSGRIHIAAMFAHGAMHRMSQKLTIPLIKRFPQLLSFGAKLSGKIQQVIPLDN